MTCIVGLIDSGVVYLGGDACSVDNFNVWDRKTPKVWQAGELVVGCSGAPIVEQTIRYRFEWPTLASDADVMEWACADVVPAIRAALANVGQIGRGTTGNPQGMDMMDAGVIVGVRGRLFDIGANFAVTAVTQPFLTIGAGSSVADGALWALLRHVKNLNPPQMVLAALSAAAEFNASVCGPFTLVCTSCVEFDPAGRFVCGLPIGHSSPHRWE